MKPIGSLDSNHYRRKLTVMMMNRFLIPNPNLLHQQQPLISRDHCDKESPKRRPPNEEESDDMTGRTDTNVGDTLPLQKQTRSGEAKHTET